jgi:hypothetical protein
VHIYIHAHGALHTQSLYSNVLFDADSKKWRFPIKSIDLQALVIGTLCLLRGANSVFVPVCYIIWTDSRLLGGPIWSGAAGCHVVSHCSISLHSPRVGCNKCRLTGAVCEKLRAILQGSEASARFDVPTVVSRNITYCLLGCDAV